MKTPLHIMLYKVYQIQHKRLRSEMAQYGLYPGQPKVLRYINTHENCKLKDIAKEYDIECATASKLLDGLADNRMLERTIDQNNKRALQIRITAKGQEALSQWEKHCEAMEQMALQGFEEAEIECLKQALKRIYENLSNKVME